MFLQLEHPVAGTSGRHRASPLPTYDAARVRAMLAAGRIVLKEDMPEEIKMATLLHEILHFIADLNDLPIVKNEQVISGLANGLMTFFKDNHEAVKRIAGIKKGAKRRRDTG
jgi:hypothetical protein